MAEASRTASGKGVLAGTPAVWNPKDCWKIAFGARCVILAGSCSTKNEVGSDYSLRFVWCWDPVETNRNIASSRFQHFLRWAKPAALEAGRASSLGPLPRGILQNCCVNRIRCALYSLVSAESYLSGRGLLAEIRSVLTAHENHRKIASSRFKHFLI